MSKDSFDTGDRVHVGGYEGSVIHANNVVRELNSENFIHVVIDSGGAVGKGVFVSIDRALLNILRNAGIEIISKKHNKPRSL
jgi:hypothetical protein